MSLDQLHLLPPEEQQEILDGPALEPPNGVIPNLINPPNNNAGALAGITICLVVVTIVAMLRVYARVLVLHRVLLEDYLALSAYCLFIAFSYCCYRLLINVGFFVHQWDVPVRDLSEAFYMLHLASAFYAIIIMNTKVAILLEWVRVFAPNATNKKFQLVCRIMMVLNTLLYVSSFIVVNLSCKPHKRIWDPTVPGTCIKNKQLMDPLTAGLNIISHTIIIIIPQRVIWGLNMTTKKKIGLSLIFVIGLLALAASAVRLSVAINFITTDDKIYVLSTYALCALSEITLVMLVFCVPAIPKIIKEKNPVSRIAASIRSWTHRSANGTGGSGGGTTNTSANQKLSSTSSSTYQKIDENYVPLSHLNSWGAQISSPAGQHETIPHDGIFRTVLVEAREERRLSG